MSGEAAQTAGTDRFRVGEVIAGKFRIERPLGEGGMAHVVEATHLLLDERVALKFLRAEVLARPDIVARFSQEGRAAAKLKSEHVARVLDVGELDSVPYMVMEYLDGRDLEAIVASRGPLPISEAADLIIMACEGITDAHARGIVHRDIKPANLFLVQRDGWPTLKVLDFGISKAALSSESPFDLGAQKVNTVSLMGSPHYMSPEQLRSTKDVDRRTDIWSLGMVLFELLTGKTAFTGTELVALACQILEEPHPSLRTLLPDAPAELEAVLDRALAKSVADRYQSAGELALALLPFTASKRSRVITTQAVTQTRQSGIDPSLPLPSITAGPTSGSVAASSSMKIPAAPLSPTFPSAELAPAVESSARPPAQSMSTPTALASSRVEPPPRGGRGAVVGLLGLVAVLGVGGGLYALLRQPPPTSNATSSTPPRPTGEVVSSSPVAVSAPAAPSSPSPGASASESSTPESAPSSPSSVASAAPSLPARRNPSTPSSASPAAAKPSTPVAKASASAAPRSDLDIRRER